MPKNGMIIVTGGAGFIGSNLVASLQERNYTRIAVCDRFRDGQKWKNLARRELADIIPPERLLPYLEKAKQEIAAIFHMGAISSTTATDVDTLLDTNFSLSLSLWQWCAENGVPFIYASSAATYGDGAQGFKDDMTLRYLASLRPLNPYGWSKNLFDQHCARAALEEESPPQWVGLKFFNVYGPNEYHKGAQKSVLCHMFPTAKNNLAVQLFASQNPRYENGEQRRDFVSVKDCCDIMLWFLQHPGKSGIYNVGTGKARTFNELAHALFSSLGSKAKIDYIDMPKDVARHYQYHTEADMARLRAAGYDAPLTALEEGVKEYVTRFLNTENPYR